MKIQQGETGCSAMYISLNIILDSISHYRHEVHVELPTDKAFRRMSLLPREISKIRSECLYVCRLSEAMRAVTQTSGFNCMCLRDRIQDERETQELLSGMIIINENLELEQLFSEVQETFILMNDWYEDMQDAIIKHKSMQDIISMSEPVIGNFISVSDSSLSLLAYTKNISTDDPTSLFLIENGYHSEETIKKFKKYKRFELWMNSDGLIISDDGQITKYVTINKVFKFNDTYFTHVVMTCNHRLLTPGLIDLFNQLTYVLTYYIKRNWEEKKDYDHVYSALVVDLLQGSACEKDAVNERARFIGIRPDDQFIVMLLTSGNTGLSVFPGLMAQDISRRFSRIRPVYYNCRLMLFLHHADIAHFMAEEDMESRLNSYFQENDVFCGISDVFDDLLELPEACSQAELALNESGLYVQNRTDIWEASPKWSNIAHFNTYFASCLLDKSEKNEKLWRSSRYGKMLLELYESDLEKNTNNLEVLYTFLMNERRATETAAYLHMHRNNVVYRISRIEEMLNVNLNDILTRFNLVMSFMMLKSSGVSFENAG
jgi:sugar diacid utilization regulator